MESLKQMGQIIKRIYNLLILILIFILSSAKNSFADENYKFISIITKINLLSAQIEESSAIIKYKTETGETWIITEKIYQHVPEPEIMKNGNYEIQITNSGYLTNLFRVDKNSGKTWIYKNKRWESLWNITQ